MVFFANQNFLPSKKTEGFEIPSQKICMDFSGASQASGISLDVALDHSHSPESDVVCVSLMQGREDD